MKTHTSLRCQNRSRLTPVQRKRPPEKRRCYEALKLHALWKCKNRSRTTPVQRKRSSVQPPVQTCRSESATTDGKPAAKLSILVELKGRLRPIGPTTFESKRPQADPYSHGYSPKNTNLS